MNFSSRVRAAAEAAQESVVRTPVLRHPALDDLAGGPLYLKLENLQRGGAFKFRGAFTAISRRLEGARAHGVVTASSGNHGTAVALAGRALGVSARVVMPEDAPAVKVSNVRKAGGEVEFRGCSSGERLARASEISEHEGRLMVPPYDDDDVITGQGTVALEALEQVPDMEVFLAPCGGGGLLSGCAGFLGEERPRIEVYGVETSAADDTRRSFLAGRRVSISHPDTIADGMRALVPGEMTFPIIRKHCRDILLVEDREVVDALARLLFDAKVLAEPTGAVATAAALGRHVDLRGRTAVAVVSGGNVDREVLIRCLEEVATPRRDVNPPSIPPA